MGANPHANGGMLLRDLRPPRLHRDYAVEVFRPRRGRWRQDMVELGALCPRRASSSTRKARNFRIFAPDEALSNKLHRRL
ncbi:MAG: hypothetical protein ACLRWQ_19515 [Flavonifractor plautii]